MGGSEPVSPLVTRDGPCCPAHLRGFPSSSSFPASCSHGPTPSVEGGTLTPTLRKLGTAPWIFELEPLCPSSPEGSRLYPCERQAARVKPRSGSHSRIRSLPSLRLQRSPRAPADLWWPSRPLHALPPAVSPRCLRPPCAHSRLFLSASVPAPRGRD